MSNALDVRRFIAEIHQRPALWDVRSDDYKARHLQAELWKEISEIVLMDVDQCKRKWKNLRDAYRAEAKRTERRIESDKLTGVYSDDNHYKSKWAYFDAMSFIQFSKRRPFTDFHHDEDVSNSNSPNRTPNRYLNDTDLFKEEHFHNVSNVKLEPEHSSSMEHEPDNMNSYAAANTEDDDEAANDLLFEEFQNIATPQAARRLSETLSMVNTAEHKAHLAQQETEDKNTPGSIKANINCKCSQRTDEQVHFLEDLGREEQKLITSTKQEIKSSSNLDHIGDSDYNFLVSFLPQMKKMNELQNLQFRAKMCEIVLNILAPTMAEQLPAIPAGENVPAVCLKTDTEINCPATCTSSNNLI